MKAYLWDRQGRPVKVVNAEDPAPRIIVIDTIDPRYERVFWRCHGRTMQANPSGNLFLGQDYEEGDESPRLIGAAR